MSKNIQILILMIFGYLITMFVGMQIENRYNILGSSDFYPKVDTTDSRVTTEHDALSFCREKLEDARKDIKRLKNMHSSPPDSLIGWMHVTHCTIDATVNNLGPLIEKVSEWREDINSMGYKSFIRITDANDEKALIEIWVPFTAK